MFSFCKRNGERRIRSYLVEGGGIQHFQIELKFWHYTTNNNFWLLGPDINIWNCLLILLWKEFIYFTLCSLTLQIPVCKKENFTGLQVYRKRGKSARASPTPHHTLNKERSARFTALLSRPWNDTACVKKGPLRGQPFYLWAGEGGWLIWAHGQAGVFQHPHIEIRSFLLFKTPQQTENFLFWEQAVYFNYYYSLGPIQTPNFSWAEPNSN